MNFLALAQRLHLMLRIGVETPGTEPTTVVGQTGVLSEIVQWVAASHDDLCLLHSDWKFMQGTGELSLPAAGRIVSRAAIVSAIPTFGRLTPMVGSEGAFMLLVPTAEAATAAEHPVVYIPHQKWYGHYDVAPISTGQPRYFTIRPDRGIEFDAIADRAYTVRTTYRKELVPLTVDASEPMMSDEYHMAIVEWAVVNYYCAGREGVKEMLTKHSVMLRRELTRLRNEQLPDFTVF